MKAREIKLPDNLLVSKYIAQADYFDCFSLKLDSSGTKSVQDYSRMFFTHWPQWVQTLFKLRNYMVAPVGLKASKDVMNELVNPTFNFNKGSNVAFFYISEITKNEILLFDSDKHLDTRLSICLDQKGKERELLITTVVKYNNFHGKTYFFFVKPFHKIIVKNKLDRMNRN
jgi:hypothetical protein